MYWDSILLIPAVPRVSTASSVSTHGQSPLTSHSSFPRYLFAQFHTPLSHQTNSQHPQPSQGTLSSLHSHHSLPVTLSDLDHLWRKFLTCSPATHTKKPVERILGPQSTESSVSYSNPSLEYPAPLLVQNSVCTCCKSFNPHTATNTLSFVKGSYTDCHHQPGFKLRDDSPALNFLATQSSESSRSMSGVPDQQVGNSDSAVFEGERDRGSIHAQHQVVPITQSPHPTLHYEEYVHVCVGGSMYTCICTFFSNQIS